MNEDHKKAHQEWLAALMKQKLLEWGVKHPKPCSPALVLTLDQFKPKPN